MEVIQRSATGYAQDPTKYFNFQRFSREAGDFTLVEGAFEQSTLWSQFGFTDEEITRLLKRKIVRLEFEEPNKFFIGDNMSSYDTDFYRVFTLCPYTAKWLNAVQGKRRRVPIFFPFNEHYIPKKLKKQWDIIYTGHIVSQPVLRDIQTISQFNYRLVSNSSDPLVTNHGASYEEKMSLIAQSRITLVQNLLYPRFYHVINVWRYPEWRKNEAFRFIPGPESFWKFFTERDRIVVPQLKSRVFEAAFGRSLILCKRDPFNVIERYFTPGKEFIYFEEGQLAEKIEEVLQNYSDYLPVIENAFNRAKKEYTTKAFFETYLKDLV